MTKSTLQKKLKFILKNREDYKTEFKEKADQSLNGV